MFQSFRKKATVESRIIRWMEMEFNCFACTHCSAAEDVGTIMEFKFSSRTSEKENIRTKKC